ncbi:helix-turn-helix domain-containing protein [Flavobacterium sp. W20_MBD1_R3]|uniref:helix-turn-helix domain-containing protein n=1 Tax=Flavobacterium sp. W20_MBD1_R3 TaxID=3240278 RepID=UPI003F90CE56
MNQPQFLQSFKNLLQEVQDLKTLQQRVLLYLENHNGSKAEIPLLIEERISVKETCQILGCSEVTLWKLRKDGTLPYTQHKRTIRFKKIDILNYLNKKR